MYLKSVLQALTLSAVLGVCPSLSWAQDNLGKHTTPSGIEYVSGGVGDECKEDVETSCKDYNFRLTFARPNSGSYLADVQVTIENTKTHEKVVDVVSGGPLFFAQLPVGQYKVTAEFEAKQQVKTVSIRKGHPREIVFYFAN